MRKLASIQIIEALVDIPEADNIVMARVLGWEVVVKKNEFAVGDFCVYCEVDSILPAKPEFEFLAPVKYRIKTRRLRGQISQGIIFPMSVLEGVEVTALDVGTDVTEALGIVKYDPPEEDTGILVGGKPGRSQTKGLFPSWISKTDETRIQAVPGVLVDAQGMVCYVAEKVDGCLDENTLITTPNGDVTIKELCESSYTGQVKGVDLQTNLTQWTDVVATSIRKNIGNWYELELEDGTILRLTGNHRVWLPTERCYRRTDELLGDEEVLLLKN